MAATKKDSVQDFKTRVEKYTKNFSKIIFKDAILSKKVSLLAVLEKKGAKNPQKIIDTLRDIIESQIYAVVDYYSVIQYVYMEKTGNWTEAGQDRVKLSYIRLMLDIPEEKEVSFQDYSKFEEKMNEKKRLYKLDMDPAVQVLLFKINNPEIEILERKYNSSSAMEINKVLDAVGSSRKLMIGISGNIKSMLFGISNSIRHSKYDIHFMLKEEKRTPNMVQYIVAVIEQNQVVVRYSVCKYVFYNKWLSVFDYDMFQMESFSTLDEENVAESIKKALVKSFEVSNREEFEEKLDEFLEAMTENLMYHEIAHDALEDGNIDFEELALPDGITTQKETIISIMNEVMTEFLPKKQNINGPIKNIIDTAFVKGNQKKAELMLLIYMSDAWFLDTDTTFMYSYNYIMFVILLKYIGKGREIDFASMYNDLDSIFNFLSDWYRKTLSDISVAIKKLKYNNNSQDYKELETQIKKEIASDDKKYNRAERTDEEQIGNYWINFFIYLNREDKSALNKILDLVEAKETDLYSSLMKQFASIADQKEYGADVRKYIIDKMLAVGFNLEDVS